MSIIINQHTQALSLLTEVASSGITLGRSLVKNESGFLEAVFPVSIRWDEVTYELDAQGNKIDIYENKSNGSVELEPAEIYALYTEAILLGDGTETTMGEHLAKRTDAILKAKLGLVEIV